MQNVLDGLAIVAGAVFTVILTQDNAVVVAPVLAASGVASMSLGDWSRPQRSALAYAKTLVTLSLATALGCGLSLLGQAITA